MKLFTEFYADYLLHKMTPGDVIKAKPYLKDVWYDEPTGQFGRPASYHHQVQQLDVPGAWQKINYPALIICGEYDWIMSIQEHEYIEHIVNATHSGNGELKIISQMDHHFSNYKNRQEAFEGAYINYSTEAFTLIFNWINKNLN